MELEKASTLKASGAEIITTPNNAPESHMSVANRLKILDALDVGKDGGSNKIHIFVAGTGTDARRTVLGTGCKSQGAVSRLFYDWCWRRKGLL
ncbi:hypothetical protein AX774_g3203 [Zancudomyces culisetae]|uniref:Uncharacterized protein n=1 Tax=Zancudomyces culisetae TaxID=1213189 RepID=A0A1R1PQT3_ZANCU|nr:hypothetical protein AX774_g3203 [Zancudomyces culisetae]|eukprot:OMH83291.1 hypothetical protein AX774_g3203 [Zancudomyces culisetae]